MRTKTPDLDQRILDTAARLFAGNHFHEVRMEDIAAEADVGKGTLYRYFHDKEELYMALLKRAADQIGERLEEVEEEGGEPMARLERIVQMTLEFFQEQRHVFELITQAEASRGIDHPWQETRERFIKAVGDVFRDARSQGIFTIRDPVVTGLVLLGGVRAIIRFGPKENPARLAESIVRTILDGAATKK